MISGASVWGQMSCIFFGGGGQTSSDLDKTQSIVILLSTCPYQFLHSQLRRGVPVEQGY